MSLKDNLHFSIEMGAKIIEISKEDFNQKILEVKKNISKNELFINQGAKDTYSKYGIKIQATFINNYINKNNIKDIDIFVASGTGTSAFYLRKYLNKTINVYTTSCVGSTKYLIKQFDELNVDDLQVNYPTILETKKKYHFGQCYEEFMAIYNEIIKEKIDFEFLYDMKSLLCIKENHHIFKKNLLYIHCGGIYANTSMKERYKFKF
jgi:1-aminocyclopropane-1-carboxylate deaminase/D-cysteine desulfhydrase-like pyridoxal-dependent ACC family enzyme